MRLFISVLNIEINLSDNVFASDHSNGKLCKKTNHGSKLCGKQLMTTATHNSICLNPSVWFCINPLHYVPFLCNTSGMSILIYLDEVFVYRCCQMTCTNNLVPRPEEEEETGPCFSC